MPRSAVNAPVMAPMVMWPHVDVHYRPPGIAAAIAIRSVGVGIAQWPWVAITKAVADRHSDTDTH